MQVAVAEPLVWRVMDMVTRLNLDAATQPVPGQTVAAATDLPVQISLVTASDVAASVRWVLLLSYIATATAMLPQDELCCTGCRHALHCR